MHSISRRALVSSIAGVSIGSVAVSTAFIDTSKASLSGELDVQDKTKEIQDPIQSATLDVTGNLSWESDTIPDRVILRLKLKEANTTEQLAADSISSNLQATDSRAIDFSVNLLDHSELTAPMLSPTQNGDTNSINATAILSIELEKDGTTLAQKEVTDTFSISTTKTVGSATISVGATGDITVKTS